MDHISFGEGLYQVEEVFCNYGHVLSLSPISVLSLQLFFFKYEVNLSFSIEL